MGVFNGVFPILQGKEDASRKFAAETIGARKADFEALQARSNVTRETWALQETPMGSFMLVWFEGDVEKAFSDLAGDNSEFTTWFRAKGRGRNRRRSRSTTRSDLSARRVDRLARLTHHSRVPVARALSRAGTISFGGGWSRESTAPRCVSSLANVVESASRVGLYDRVMSLEWEQTIVDARDPVVLGNWWREALGWVVVNDDPDEFEIRPAADRLPGLLFASVPESKQTKNRLHLDFRPDDRDGGRTTSHAWRHASGRWARRAVVDCAC